MLQCCLKEKHTIFCSIPVGRLLARFSLKWKSSCWTIFLSYAKLTVHKQFCGIPELLFQWIWRWCRVLLPWDCRTLPLRVGKMEQFSSLTTSNSKLFLTSIISELRYRTTLLHDTCHMIFSSSHHWHKKYNEKTLFLKPKVLHAFLNDLYLHVYLFILHLSLLLDKSIDQDRVNIIQFYSWTNFLSWYLFPFSKIHLVLSWLLNKRNNNWI